MARAKKQLPTHTLAQIIEGFELTARSRELSEHTLSDYRNTFRKFQAHLGRDPVFIEITQADVEGFLAAQTVSKKTKLNYHTGLSSLWTWAYKQGLATRHILHEVGRPKPEKRAIIPYTEADIRAMLAAIASSKPYKNRGTISSHSLPNQERNRAIILLMVDTGVRAEELVTLRVADIDRRNERIKIFGKGSKEREVHFSARTGQALWNYWARRRPDLQPDDLAFVTEDGLPMDRHRLLKQIVAIGKRAGVPDPDCHRFRHTFAINFLRNGGDVYSLQAILGHATLEMCRKYLALAQSDTDAAHRRASPVANMRL